MKNSVWCNEYTNLTYQSCPGDPATYNESKSSTFYFNASQLIGIKYGTGEMIGAKAWDKFCFSDGENCFEKDLVFVGAY